MKLVPLAPTATRDPLGERVRSRREQETEVERRMKLEVEKFKRRWFREHLARPAYPFTKAEYLSVLAALHPDTTDAKRRHDAFIPIKAKERLLHEPPELAAPPRTRAVPPPMPATTEEMRARRKHARQP
jgi:hypothetical protein